MATATRRPAAKKSATKPAPAPVEEVEVEETETEEIFGVADVVELIKTKLKKETTTRELRTLLRKMARDGRLDREIIAGNRTRWEFAGPEDPEVLAILKAFGEGELEQDKREKLNALKERKAKAKAEAAAAAEAEEDDEVEEEAPAPKKTTRRRAAAKKPAAKVVEVDEDDEELEED
jgi:hypothetical protein